MNRLQRRDRESRATKPKSSTTVEDRIRSEFRAGYRGVRGGDYSIGQLRLRLARKYQRPVREIKAIVHRGAE